METEIISELAGNIAALLITSVNLPVVTGLAIIGVFKSFGKLWGSGVERRRNRKAEISGREQNYIQENDHENIN